MAKNKDIILQEKEESPVTQVTNEILRFIGRPTEYSPDACNKIVEAAAKGAHTAGMILAAGAKSRTTYYNWQKDYPEFKEAVELANLVSQAYYENPDVIKNIPTTSWAIIMNNKFPEDYSRTGQTTTSNTTNINFNTLNLTDSQKINRIKGLLEKLNTAGKDLGQYQDAEIIYNGE